MLHLIDPAFYASKLNRIHHKSFACIVKRQHKNLLAQAAGIIAEVITVKGFHSEIGNMIIGAVARCVQRHRRHKEEIKLGRYAPLLRVGGLARHLLKDGDEVILLGKTFFVGRIEQ